MSTVRWFDIRDKHIEAIGREDVDAARPGSSPGSAHTGSPTPASGAA